MPIIEVFRRKINTAHPNWSIGVWYEDNAARVHEMIRTTPTWTIGKWFEVASDVPKGWSYAGRAPDLTRKDFESSDSLNIYYLTHDGKTEFDVATTYFSPEQARRMGLPATELIRLTNDGKYARFAAKQHVVGNFAWDDVHRFAREDLEDELCVEMPELFAIVRSVLGGTSRTLKSRDMIIAENMEDDEVEDDEVEDDEVEDDEVEDDEVEDDEVEDDEVEDDAKDDTEEEERDSASTPAITTAFAKANRNTSPSI